MSRLRSSASNAEREVLVAQGSIKQTSKRMHTAIELASALRGEAARWAESADAIEVGSARVVVLSDTCGATPEVDAGADACEPLRAHSSAALQCKITLHDLLEPSPADEPHQSSPGVALHSALASLAGCVQTSSELLIGDVLLACAAITYGGGMLSAMRARLAAIWHADCCRLNIPVSPTFSISAVLAKPVEVRFSGPCAAVQSSTGQLCARERERERVSG